MITSDQIAALASRFETDHDTVLREYLQVVFLFHLYENRKGDALVFKGGTALRLLYGSFRFSEDLDFTSLVSGKETRAIVEAASRTMEREAPGVTLGDFRITKESLITRLLFHASGAKYPISIHLECSLRERPAATRITMMETLYPVTSYPMIVHLKAEELLAEKVRALLVRAKGRDLFDLWYLLSREIPVDWRLVNRKMAVYKRKVALSDVTSAVEKFETRSLVRDLGKFLAPGQRQVISQLQEKTLLRLGSQQ